MITLFILGLLLGGVAVVFALQNTEIITVAFYGWSLTGSLSVIIALSIGTGAAITLLLLLPESINNYFRHRKLRNENQRLEEELRKQKEKTVFAAHTPPSGEDLRKISEGEIAHPEQ